MLSSIKNLFPSQTSIQNHINQNGIDLLQGNSKKIQPGASLPGGYTVESNNQNSMVLKSDQNNKSYLLDLSNSLKEHRNSEQLPTTKDIVEFILENTKEISQNKSYNGLGMFLDITV